MTTLAQKSILKRVYESMMENANKPQAMWIIGGISFAESSVFPLPPDLMMIPMILANRQRAWWIAFICSVTSVIGALVGYAIGYYFFTTIGQWVIETYNLSNAFDWFQQEFQEKGFWIILAKGLTPIPFKLVTIASGAAQLNLTEFIIASVIARSFRFYLLAGLLWFFGEKARFYIDRYLGWIFGAILISLVLGVLVVKYLF